MAAFRVTHALCRDLPDSFEDSLKLEPPPIPISIPNALEQHRGYVSLLRGLEPRINVIEVAADIAMPDCVFIEDTALLVAPGTAVITRPGAPSRQGETGPVEAALRQLGLPRICCLTAPATLDGGDVQCLGWAVLVGLSKRTNAAAVSQLRQLMGEHGGPPVYAFEVRGDHTLHFKSVLSALDSRTLLVADTPTGRDLAEQIRAVPELAPPQLELHLVPDVTASNVLSINSHVVMQPGYPASEAIVRALCDARGMTLHTCDQSELAKADGALTCCSLLFALE